MLQDGCKLSANFFALEMPNEIISYAASGGLLQRDVLVILLEWIMISQ